ncbi:MAG: hypothetical protein FWG98_02535 [Candidatus Cloacimonetes bacterium]|nr:hypothetical protein [Candidatus Cloacimonadota bacterium]
MKIFFLIIIISFFISLQAQEREISYLFESNWINTVNIYGNFETKISQVDDDWGVFVGAKGGIMVNDTYTLCLAGYVLFPQPTDLHCTNYGYKNFKFNELRGGYGGLVFEYIYRSSNLFHASVSTLVGVGGMKISHESKYYHTYYRYNDHPLRSFMIFEPGLHANLNLTRNFKATIGTSYRITPNTSLKYHGREFATSSVFDGLSINMGIVFYDFF